MKFTYPAVLLKDPDSIYGLVFPDLACYPSNETLEGLMTDAQEALALHIEVTLEEGLELADPTPLDEIDLSEYDNPLRLVTISAEVTAKAERINITMDKALLAAVDRRAKNRSRFIAEAVKKALG